MRPSIAGCNSKEQGSCHLDVTGIGKDWLGLECSIGEIYPKPTLNWSYSGCDGRITPIFFPTTTSTYNQDSQTYNVTSIVFIVDLLSWLDACKFTCTAYGDAITDQTIPADIVLTRKVNASLK